jgi:tetratricopeptide (TPR) repeat protein
MDDIYNAAGFADKALDLSNTTDDKLTSADIYRVKGIIEKHLKNYNAAKTFLLNSLSMYTSLKNTLNIAETSFELGLLNDDVGNEREKTEWLQKSLRYYSDIDATEKVTMVEELLKTNLN